MSLFIDRKYVLLVSTKLENFKRKGDYLFNCRCKLCGDSKKDRTKSRGYFYRLKSGMFYKCHNCSASMSIGSFLKTTDHTLWNEYKLETFQDRTPEIITNEPVNNETFKETTQLNIPSIESLPDNHYAKVYVKSRMIPEEAWNKLYYTEDFSEFCDAIYPNHGKKIPKTPRLIIPFFDEKNIFQGAQGRALVDSEIRYITIRARDQMKKVFGLEKIDFNKTIYVVEGPIDSLFLPNCIATLDSGLYRVLDSVGDYDFVFVPDNEPRNKELLGVIRKMIKMGLKVCIWPNHIKEKDINDMILAGLDPMKIIKENTFSGLTAELKYAKWRKI